VPDNGCGQRFRVVAAGYGARVPVNQQRVLREAEDWVWVPVDAQEDLTDERRLTVYPERACVQWSRTDRPFDDLLAEVTERAERTGRSALRWWTGSTSRPVDTGERLQAAGFQKVEVLDVLALDLAERGALARLAARLDVPADVEVRAVTDMVGLRTAADVSAEAFGEPPPTEAQMVEALGLVLEELQTGRWRSRWSVAWQRGEPVGTGGATLVGDTVRLWNGCVLPGARGRGVYRALLVARCCDAAAAGATTALVKGRVATSGPVLRRAGFEVFGQEVCYERALAGR
jgi:GNAT superfamily N-acetyltransferase